MAGTEIQRRLTWLVAEVVSVREETRRVRTIAFRCPGWTGHLPGQHVDIRLTAEDGYQAQRSYSLAAPADGDRVAITVELVEGGEVSPYLVEELRPGDRLELRGPIGGYFVWVPNGDGPVQLVGGGSGVVPLMAMLRARIAHGDGQAVRLLYSARSYDDIIYRSELQGLASQADGVEILFTLTRSQPPGWDGLSRRIDRPMLSEITWPSQSMPVFFVCGPTGFVESAAGFLVDLGHPPERIRTERFGPTGGPP